GPLCSGALQHAPRDNSIGYRNLQGCLSAFLIQALRFSTCFCSPLVPAEFPNAVPLLSGDPSSAARPPPPGCEPPQDVPLHFAVLPLWLLAQASPGTNSSRPAAPKMPHLIWPVAPNVKRHPPNGPPIPLPGSDGPRRRAAGAGSARNRTG